VGSIQLEAEAGKCYLSAVITVVRKWSRICW
jgi:hypothetical protein